MKKEESTPRGARAEKGRGLAGGRSEGGGLSGMKEGGKECI